jgi:hypothetical protein
MADRLSDQEVQALIYIANAGIKEKRAHWYTFGIPIGHRYGLDEQLEAITKLGESKNKSALDFLTRMSYEDDSRSTGFRSSDGINAHYILKCPNARGQLKKVQEYDELNGWDPAAGESISSDRHPRRESVKSILEKAISSLSSEAS